ncbi:MAG: hypothetical protein KatS3mg129_1254 [Leptospiraceae bacterium]|nr:MAG: hypothetical protein KatS3mg129_1254 [Leptospiraceae bacterium]
MNAKTLKNILIMSLWLLMVFHCKNLVHSSADQPFEDYNLLALLDQKVLNGFYWEGLMDYSQCNTPSTDPVEDLSKCSLYQENYENFIKQKEKNLYVYVDSLQSNGKITIEIANPDTYLPLKVEIPVLSSITVGPETGNGYARILYLSNPNSITQSQITITLKEFKADVLQDGLRGSMSLDVQSNNGTLNLTFSFSIKKIY